MRVRWCLLALLHGCSPKAADSSLPSDPSSEESDSGAVPPGGPDRIPIYVGDVELRSDADVDLLEGYEVIQGSVGLLEGVTDLSKLYALEEITGSLRIEDTTTLPSLAGLENVHTIGVDLGIRGSTLTSFAGLDALASLEGLTVEDTEVLTDLSALSRIGGLSRNLVITNTNLSSLVGLEGLTEVRGYLNIEAARALPSLTGLENVTYVGKTLFVVKSPLLESLEGLAGLTTVNESISIAELPLLRRASLPVESVAGNVQIVRNQSLEMIDLSGLMSAGEVEIHGNPLLAGLDAHALVEVSRWFQIDDNNALTALGDFSSLSTVGERVSVTRNDSLSSIVASLPALRSVGENLDIHDNPALPACEVDALADALTELGGLVVNTGNREDASCN